MQVTPWAEVFVDGKTQGDTPFAPLEFPAGAHTIEVRHPQLGSQTQHVVLRAGEPKKSRFRSHQGGAMSELTYVTNVARGAKNLGRARVEIIAGPDPSARAHATFGRRRDRPRR